MFSTQWEKFSYELAYFWVHYFMEQCFCQPDNRGYLFVGRYSFVLLYLWHILWNDNLMYLFILIASNKELALTTLQFYLYRGIFAFVSTLLWSLQIYLILMEIRFSCLLFLLVVSWQHCHGTILDKPFNHKSIS